MFDSSLRVGIKTDTARACVRRAGLIFGQARTFHSAMIENLFQGSLNEESVRDSPEQAVRDLILDTVAYKSARETQLFKRVSVSPKSVWPFKLNVNERFFRRPPLDKRLPVESNSEQG
jgi:hypothetical protein